MNNSSLALHKCLVTLMLLASFNGWLHMSLRGLSDLLKVVQLQSGAAGIHTQVCLIQVHWDQDLATLAGGCLLAGNAAGHDRNRYRRCGYPGLLT